MKICITDTLPLINGVLLIVLAMPTSGRADGAKLSEGVFTLGEIEVTGAADKEKNVTVEKIYAEELRDFDRNNLADAATLLPGVTASASGARNEQTLYVRGFDIKHVPIYLDGIPIYVPYDGYPDLGRFTTFDLSEVVVSKGFTSVLYGPNTMGGAINMVSRRPEKTFEGNAGAGINSDSAYNTYMNMGTSQENWYVQAGASYQDSDYYFLSDDFSPTKTENGNRRENSYQQDEKLNLKVGFTPNKDDEYAFSYIYQHGEKGSPPYAGTSPTVTARYWQWPYWDKQSYYFTSKTDFDGKAYLKTRAFYDVFENSLNSYDNSSYTTISKPYAFRSSYDDYTDGGSVEIGTPFIAHNLIKLAGHYKQDVHREHNDGKPDQRFEDQIFSVGLEDTITFSNSIYAITGVSYDTVDTQDAEDVNSSGQIVDFPKGDASGVNPQFGLFYTPSEVSTLHASIARKTRLPSIKDRYSYRLGTAIPNPYLDPEQSINYEIGYEDKHLEKIRWQTTVFFNDVSDYIQLIKVADPDLPGMTTDQNQNIGEVDMYGVELEASGYVLTSLEIGCNYTYTKADNQTNSSELTNIPEHKIVTYLKYTFLDNFIALADAEYDSKRYSSSDGKQVAGEFTVANLKLSYDFGNGILAETGVKNIFDRNYELEEGYPEAGRTLFANMRYTF